MIDWLSTYSVSVECYYLDPATWMETGRVEGVSAFGVERDSTLATVETATVTCESPLTDRWLRCYASVTQDGRTEKELIATVVCKASRRRFGGARGAYYECDCYSPLKAAACFEVEPGRTVSLGDPLAAAAEVLEEATPAPVVAGWESSGEGLYTANPDDLSALTLARTLAEKAGARLAVDPSGRVWFDRVRDPASLGSSWTFTDSEGETSVYADLDESDDTADIPNCMRVHDEASGLVGYAENAASGDVSVRSRGYRQFGKAKDAAIGPNPTRESLDAEALRLLRMQSRRTREAKVAHVYCGIQLGQGVAIEHERAGITGVVGEVTYTSVEVGTEMRCETTVSYSEDLMEA